MTIRPSRVISLVIMGIEKATISIPYDERRFPPDNRPKVPGPRVWGSPQLPERMPGVC